MLKVGSFFIQIWTTTLFIQGGLGYEPQFGAPMMNLSIAVGREATFSCVVEHLGGYRVGWVKADTKAIQAIHEHVVTHNPRVSVTHSDHSTWNLHIKNVQEDDRGTYMCQLNTDPMKSEMSYLDVVVPPDIVDEETSGDTMVSEGGSVTLRCRARGYPRPEITWKREDRQEIVFRELSGIKNRVLIHEGEILRLGRVSRSDMGSYMCMASNGVPPAVSKRITIHVHFAPVIQVPNQLVGAPLGTDVTLECMVEASPKAIIYWMKDKSDNMIVNSEKYETRVTIRSLFETRMVLTVQDFSRNDVGTYRCVAKNSLGEVERSIRLYEIPGTVRRKHPPISYEDITEEDEEEEEPIVLRPNSGSKGHIGGSRGTNNGGASRGSNIGPNGINGNGGGNRRQHEEKNELAPTPALAGQASSATSSVYKSSLHASALLTTFLFRKLLKTLC